MPFRPAGGASIRRTKRLGPQPSSPAINEALLKGIADGGGGHFYFVRDVATIRDHITSEVSETLEVVARDAAIEVVAAEGVEIEAISPQPTQRHGTRTGLCLGDLVAEQVLDIVLRVTFPHGESAARPG